MGFSTFRAMRYLHEVRGEWCSCGEPVNDCMFHTVFFPAHEQTMSELYRRVFSDDDDDERPRRESNPR